MQTQKKYDQKREEMLFPLKLGLELEKTRRKYAEIASRIVRIARYPNEVRNVSESDNGAQEAL